MRIRTGVTYSDGGWWVVQQIDNERRFYGPPGGGPFATEAEADAKATEAAAATRRAVGVQEGKT